MKIKEKIKKNKKTIFIISFILMLVGVIIGILLCLKKNVNISQTVDSEPTPKTPDYKLKRNINKKMKGKTNNVGVPYTEKDIHSNGRNIKDYVGPDFEGPTVSLGETVDEAYARHGNNQDKFYHGTMKDGIEKLKQEINADPSIATKYNLSQTDINSINNNETPAGKVMHHRPETDENNYILMQLVDEDQHRNSGHTGGSCTWNPNKSVPI